MSFSLNGSFSRYSMIASTACDDPLVIGILLVATSQSHLARNVAIA